jgi:hypothetical protein
MSSDSSSDNASAVEAAAGGGYGAIVAPACEKLPSGGGKAPASAAATEGPLTPWLVVSLLAVTIGSCFQFGYHIGNVNAPATVCAPSTN